ncbi:MAG TPA: hypothetical protein DCQ06_08190, partial [Myxococcales bacterium]|nr:hypothetical protein [Myxococcales bacterium]
MFSVTIRDKGGQVYTFHFDKPEILIGRVKGNDVILPKQNISKRHAMVRVQGTTFIIEDLGSTNGTYVNGHRIQTPVQVGTDDKVHLGDFLLQFFDLTEPLNDGSAGSGAPPPVPTDPAELEASAAAMIAAEAAEQAEAAALSPQSDDAIVISGGFEAVVEMSAAGLSLDDKAVAAEVAEQLQQLAPSAAPQPVSIADSGDDLSEDSEELAAALEAAVAVFDDGQDLTFDVDHPDLTGPAEIPVSATGVVEMDLAESPLAQDPMVAANPPPVADTHSDALSMLFDAAVVDLADVLSVDVNHLSESQWASMEARVVEFVEARSDQIGQQLDTEQLTRDLIYEISGLGPLESLLDDAEIARIEINSPGDIWLHRGTERTRTSMGFSGVASLTLASERLMKAAGVASKSEGLVAGTLSDGTSITVIWPPLCPSGPVLNLVKSMSMKSSIAEMIEANSVSEVVAQGLQDSLKQGLHVAIVSPDLKLGRALIQALLSAESDSTRQTVLQRGQLLEVNKAQVVSLDGTQGVESITAAAAVGAQRVVVPHCDLDVVLQCASATGGADQAWLFSARDHSA